MPDIEVKVMSEDLAAQLNGISRFLNGHEDGSDLWAILTALRGPDYADDCSFELMQQKAATTAVIRYQLGVRDGRFGAIINPDSDEFAAIRNRMSGSGWSHFRQHAQRAFEALGMSWNVNNHPGVEQPRVGFASNGLMFRHISANAAVV